MKKNKEKQKENDISQSAKLRKIVKETRFVVCVGIVLLIVMITTNLFASSVKSAQLRNTMYLDQYRLGSKTLTSQVQSYAVTGEQTYYDAYRKELNEDKNRDIAWEGLKKGDLTAEEWNTLEKIAELSNSLVPIEEEAIKYSEDGNTSKATAFVFGEAYENTVQEINDLTNKGIDAIQARESKQNSMFNIIMIISQILFVLSFLYIVLTVIHTIKFSEAGRQPGTVRTGHNHGTDDGTF